MGTLTLGCPLKGVFYARAGWEEQPDLPDIDPPGHAEGKRTEFSELISASSPCSFSAPTQTPTKLHPVPSTPILLWPATKSRPKSQLKSPRKSPAKAHQK